MHVWSQASSLICEAKLQQAKVGHIAFQLIVAVRAIWKIYIVVKINGQETRKPGIILILLKSKTLIKEKQIKCAS